MEFEDFKKLEMGDVVQNAGSGNGMIVVGKTPEGSPIVSQTLVISNASEWILIRKNVKLK